MTSVQVCRELGITYRMLDYWCRSGLLTEDKVPGSGVHRTFTEDEFSRLAFAARMVQAGVPLPLVREALDDDRAMVRLVGNLEKAATLARDFEKAVSRHPAGRRRPLRTA